MHTRFGRFLLFALIAIAPVLIAQTPAQSGTTPYLRPPQPIVDAFDAQPLPQTILSPTRQLLALTYHKGQPGIAELAQPVLRLAGARVNPKTYGPHRTPLIYAVTLKRIADGSEVKVMVPPQANLSNVKFSPDGAHLSFLHTEDNGIALWVADTLTGSAKAIAAGSDRINVNATTGDPCQWLKDNITIICELVPTGRGPAPAEPLVPAGPNVQASSGKPAPAATYEDMIKTSHDEDLFEYYFTSQLAAINTATGARTSIGHPRIFAGVTPSPSSDYLLVTTVKRPFSHLIPMSGFPEDVEIWDRTGAAVKRLADRPSREGTPLTGVEPGPRGHRWRADQPATIVWIEALDGGDLKNSVPFRDRVVAISAPFAAPPIEIMKTQWRFSSVSFTEKGIGLVSESDRTSRHTRTWILEAGAEPRKLWDRRQDAAYDNPGTPMARRDSGDSGRGGGGGRGGGDDGTAIMQNGDYLYLTGPGSSPEGDRPFLDRLNVKTLQTERLFHSAPNAYETVVAPLDDSMNRFLTRYESPTEPPNYYARNRDTTAKRPVTQFSDPQPPFRGVAHQFVTYKRNDGVTLSGTLYTPPGYKQGEKVPLIMWAYPREFGDADSASQIAGSPNRFTLVSGYSHLFLLLSGYAVLDNPTMPIVGPGETANDHYVEQLVASAEAAIDKVVELGVADRDRIGVGGHSYGGFMTANLLAHSRLFRAGFAESGAYNRSLTPFGFQAERRTFWEVPDLYAKMSPFWYANQIKDPILLMHGEADDNSGTFPIQSERLYMALKGHGATVRYVTLPFEAHGYAARETLLHVLAERLNWFDKYVKNANEKFTIRN
jgi:dipeptidyl aminopeptidase/acylaminoacyl peptidase